MEDFKLPESAQNVIGTLDLSNKELKWIINHNEHRVCLSLIWTTKAKAKSVKKGVRHFRQDNAQDTKSSHAHKNTRTPTPGDHTNSSSSPAGQNHAASKQAALETETVLPPGKKRKRHKTPSQYRRDRKRWIEYKARKRYPVETEVSSATQPTAITVSPEKSPPCEQEISHKQPLVRSISNTAPPACPDNHLQSNEISLRDLDPFYSSPTLDTPDKITGSRNADLLAGLETPDLQQTSPDSISSFTEECSEIESEIQVIMDKVKTAASYIETVDRIMTTNPGIMTEHLLGSLQKARSAFDDATEALEDSGLPACKADEAVQELESAFTSLGERVQKSMDSSCGAGTCQ